jgi:bifunctional non-homologous end joining protein LigD
VGLFDGPKLRYAGKVGTGYTEKALADLAGRLESRRTNVSPFTTLPKEKGAHWVRPDLVAQIGFTEWTDDGKLRHPTYLGLRRDKPARLCLWSGRET